MNSMALRSIPSPSPTLSRLYPQISRGFPTHSWQPSSSMFWPAVSLHHLTEVSFPTPVTWGPLPKDARGYEAGTLPAWHNILQVGKWEWNGGSEEWQRPGILEGNGKGCAPHITSLGTQQASCIKNGLSVGKGETIYFPVVVKKLLGLLCPVPNQTTNTKPYDNIAVGVHTIVGNSFRLLQRTQCFVVTVPHTYWATPIESFLEQSWHRGWPCDRTLPSLSGCFWKLPLKQFLST